MRTLLPLFFVCAAISAFCQPPRGVELFGALGIMRRGGDEGPGGSGAAYGGAVTIPFAARWAVDVQALAAHPANWPDFRLRRVLLSPGLQYRRGNDRAFGFIAFGLGLQRDRTSGTYQAFDSNGGSRTVSFDDTESGRTLHWRTGAVFQPASRLLVRGEFFWVNRYSVPNLDVAISLGVRLGR